MTSKQLWNTVAGGILAICCSCATSSETIALRCDVAVESLSPTTAAVGDTVVMTGGPFTAAYDSAVYVDGARADVTEVDRSTCVECDICRDTYECTACGDCDVCDRLCADTCTETVSFTVPDVAAGDAQVQLFNAHGQTPRTPIVVESPLSTDSSDTGPTDTGSDTAAP